MGGNKQQIEVGVIDCCHLYHRREPFRGHNIDVLDGMTASMGCMVFIRESRAPISIDHFVNMVIKKPVHAKQTSE